MLAGHADESLFGETKKMHSKDGYTHHCNALYPITNLAGTQADIIRVMRTAREKNILVVDFSEIMGRAHRERELVDGYASTDLDHTPMIACGIYGETRAVEEIVKGLGLYGK